MLTRIFDQSVVGMLWRRKGEENERWRTRTCSRVLLVVFSFTFRLLRLYSIGELSTSAVNYILQSAVNPPWYLHGLQAFEYTSGIYCVIKAFVNIAQAI